jgi:hypothetical protein
MIKGGFHPAIASQMGINNPEFAVAIYYGLQILAATLAS